MIVSAAQTLPAQTNLKWNAAYWIFGVLNMSVETRVADHWTVGGEVVYSPWKSLDGNKLLVFQVNPDVRWYPKSAFNGFYLGAYATYQDFKITKWNYWNKGRYQDGTGYGFGGMIGFQTPIACRWYLDVYAGAGWHNGKYKGYYTRTGEEYVGSNGSGEWIPYRLGISFAYRLGSSK